MKRLKNARRIISLVSVALFLLLSLRIIWVAIVTGRGLVPALVVSVILPALSYGLVRKKNWAARGTALIYLLAAITLPIAIFNPFTAGDYIAAGKKPPDVAVSLSWMVPLEIALLSAIYILDPRKGSHEDNDR
ncbi:MAG: hypothetical protein HQK58_03855 [Deltaproteobacteria bacterium]|nr:hypothetical protein [Deltaproteobacteria bacterium]